jgi:hypothetical protein
MRRNEHVSARVLAIVGLVAAVAYLTWRVVVSMQGEPVLLAVPFFVVELVGFVGAGMLAWALWPAPSGDPDDREDRSPVTRRVDAVVRVDDQPVHEVRATLLALQSAEGVDHLVIVDLSGRPAVASLATEFQAVYAATDVEDRNGVRVMAAAVRSAEFVLIDAGDVPSTDIVGRLSTDLRDPHVAIVQGLGVSLADDSAEHGPNRRHELDFERSALNPALGRRGAAMWLGSGSLVRTDALRDVAACTGGALEVHWAVSSALLAAGWSITAPSDVAVVSHRIVNDHRVVFADRVRRTRAARQLLVERLNPLRPTSYTPAHRAAALAWSIRPLSSFRRLAFVVLLAAALLTGAAPFHAGRVALAVLWLPAFVYTALGLSLLSGWTLRPGDRTRWSLHNLGATVVSLRRDLRRPRRPAPVRARPRHATQYGPGLIVTILLLSLVLIVRGLSDRVTHTLPVMPQQALLAALVVSIWLLAISLDLLRVLARRSQLRRAQRVPAALTATLGERSVSLLDLTALGAGVLSHTGLDVGEQMLLEMSVPTRSGVTTTRIPVEVRNVSVMPLGEWRIGVEFGPHDDAAANALAEYCLIEPTWAHLGVIPGTSVTEARPVHAGDEVGVRVGAGKAAVRVMALLALVGAIASSLPTTVEASQVLHHSWVGEVVEDGRSSNPPTQIGVPGAVVTAICSSAAGADGVFGTIDDSFHSPVSAVTDDAGRYGLELDGNACWSYVAPPLGFSSPSGSFDDPQNLDLRGDLTSRTALVREPTAGSVATAVTGAAVRDLVWADQNGNGVHDSNEPGLAGVSVTLLDQVGHVVARQVTAVDGVYAFTRVPVGRYRVSVSNLPDGLALTPTSTADRGAAATESAVDMFTGRSPLVNLGAADHRSLDVGLRPSALVVVPRAATSEVFPRPDAGQVVSAHGVPPVLSFAVLALVGALAASLLLGFARPRRRVMA